MTRPPVAATTAWTAVSLFPGDDHTAAAHRAAEWAATPLGPVDTWPMELTSAVATIMASDIAMLLWWGPELTQIFNDAYAPFLGDKYPRAVGQSAPECWPDVWDDMGPLARAALDGRTSKGVETRLMMDRRGGQPEETFWTFSYSPIRASDGSVLGVFVATSDVTHSVLARRRMGSLQRLAAMSVTQGQHPLTACRTALATLSEDASDFPSTAVYLDPVATFDEEREHGAGSDDNVIALENGRIVGLVAVGTEDDADSKHRAISRGDTAAAIAAAVTVGRAERVRDADGNDNVVLPLRVSGRSEPVGALVVGVSVFHVVDDAHLSFLDAVAARLSTTLTDVLAFEFERHRSNALAEIDAAKTRLLQNVSHEFRTPLTLLLEPLRGLLGSPDSDTKASAELAYRNAVRLRRLVDSLLEVAGATTGVSTVDKEPTDIAELTRGCAAQFGGAAEVAGIDLIVDIDPSVQRTVGMDREKWERIVTNLIANAVNYTHAGSVRVLLSQSETRIILSVVDTGVGLSADDRDRVLDRFYRVKDSLGRSTEGSGIGLALVAELVQLLGGSMTVDSTLGVGSTFSVTIPIDTLVDDVASPEPHSLRDDFTSAPASTDAEVVVTPGVRGGSSRSVLLVEDNPDMRDYLTDLLAAQDWEVHAIGNVESALEHARVHRPGLILTDVMLPGRSGLDLVREARGDGSLVRLPIVVLTARSGVDSAVEGLEAGADDYVSKPFDARELVARIRVHLELSAFREELLLASNNEASTLQEAMRTRSTIGTALGLLMASEGCDVDSAFERLTTLSQHSNRKARDVAAEMVQNFHGSMER